MSDEARARLLSIIEARKQLGGIGHTTLYELIKRREVVKVNLGRRSFITAESLDSYVDRLTEAAAVESDELGCSQPPRPAASRVVGSADSLAQYVDRLTEAAAAK
jgi:hypothetical protein